MIFRIQRFNPDMDKAPYWQDFTIDLEESGAIMILDGLLWIKDHIDETLSFRRSCGEGVCGSDGMNINGKNGLACITPIGDMKLISLKPFPGMPVQRDRHDQFFSSIRNGGALFTK